MSSAAGKRILLPVIPPSPELPDLGGLATPQPVRRPVNGESPEGAPSGGSAVRVAPFNPSSSSYPEPDFTFVHLADGGGPEGLGVSAEGLENALALIKYQREDITALQAQVEKLTKFLKYSALALVIALAALALGALYVARADEYATDKSVNTSISNEIGKLQTAPTSTFVLTNNSILTGFLQDGAVTSAKLANGAVTGGKISSGTITANKLDGATQNLLSLVSAGRAVNPDNSSVEFSLSSGLLTVKSAGIDKSKLNENILASNGGLKFSSLDQGISLNTDGRTLEVAANQLSVRAKSINSSFLADEAITRAQLAAQIREDLDSAVDFQKLFNSSRFSFGPVSAAFTFDRPVAASGSAAGTTWIRGQNANAASNAAVGAGGDLIFQGGSSASGAVGGSILFNGADGQPGLSLTGDRTLSAQLNSAALRSSGLLNFTSSSSIFRSGRVELSGDDSLSSSGVALTRLGRFSSSTELWSLKETRISSNGETRINSSTGTWINSAAGPLSINALTGSLSLSASLAATVESLESLALKAPQVILSGDSSVTVKAPLNIIDAAQQLKPSELVITNGDPLTVDFSTLTSSFIKLTGSSGGSLVTVNIQNCDDSRAGMSVILLNSLSGATDSLYLSKDSCNGLLEAYVPTGQFVELKCLGQSAIGTTAARCIRPEQGTSTGGYSSISATGTLSDPNAPAGSRCGAVTLNSVAGRIVLTVTTFSNINPNNPACLQFSNSAITSQHMGIVISTIDGPGALVLQKAALSTGAARLTLIYLSQTTLNTGDSVTLAYQLI